MLLNDEDGSKAFTLELFSAFGALIRAMSIPPGMSRIDLDGDDLPKGVYYVRVTSGRESTARKVVRY